MIVRVCLYQLQIDRSTLGMFGNQTSEPSTIVFTESVLYRPRPTYSSSPCFWWDLAVIEVPSPVQELKKELKESPPARLAWWIVDQLIALSEWWEDRRAQ